MEVVAGLGWLRRAEVQRLVQAGVLRSPLLAGLEQACAASQTEAAGVRALRQALAAALSVLAHPEQHSELTFVALVVPALEMLLRLLFCRENALCVAGKAWPASYFSTLDGYGQKHKHQVCVSE